MTFDDIDELIAQAKAETLPEYLLDKQRKDSGLNPYLGFLRLLAMSPKLPAGPFLEIGVYHGTAPAHVCEASHRHGRHYYGVDLNYVPFAHPSFTLIQGDSTSDNVTSYLGSTRTKNERTNNPEQGFACIFQDSSHHYLPTVIEWNLYHTMMKKGGVWISDDITPSFQLPEEPKGMVEYWDEIPAKNKRLYENLHVGSTMGIVLF